MSEEKTQTGAHQAKTANEEQPAWTMPFPEMMAKMMARCGCRSEEMSVLWTTCCGRPSEKKEDPQTA